MILLRLGNKQMIAKDIQVYFPQHKIYCEPFFGAGGMFFNKPKAKHNIVNDIDSEVFNLYQVVLSQKEELMELYKITPYHSDLVKHWSKNEEQEPLKKAMRFLMLSNFVLNGRGYTLSYGAAACGRRKTEDFKLLLDKTFDLINGVQFMNVDFRKFFSNFQIRETEEQHFIYCDPPYLGTGDNYSNSFTETDSNDLFNLLQETKCKWAMSEFDHPFILEQAEKRGLNVIVIGERQNLKNRRTEILITNYANPLTLFNQY
nr:DNA adenine methylase [uncultured Flavobacterium sp.]